jgi:UDP-N-acetylmuramoyl-tripeptide--D-alanyl-D-alanine ligase
MTTHANPATTPITPPYAATFLLDDLLRATDAKLFNRTAPGFQSPFAAASISTDARTLTPGQVFLPLVGERFDGHEYREAAYQQGAVASFMQADHAPLLAQAEGVVSKAPNQLIVPNTLLAYQQLAHAHRKRLHAHIIGITGSSGKTTTKAMFYAAFKDLMLTQCTQKNFNNDIGVAQTLLSFDPHTQMGIVEMAMRGPGEITRLTMAAAPTVAVLTNVGPAHIERLGSLEAIALAKCEIVKGLHPDTGIVVVNGDDALLLNTLKQVWTGKTIVYQAAQGTNISTTPTGGMRFNSRGLTITLPIPGQHMMMNALAVLATAEALGDSVSKGVGDNLAAVAEGLSRYQPEEGRYALTPLANVSSAHVIQDAYNANPSSMQASLAAFLAQATPVAGQQKCVVLAGMNELGEHSAHYHQQLGQWLVGNAQQVSRLLLIGQDCLPTWAEVQKSDLNAHWVADVTAAKDWWAAQNWQHTITLIKGSRSYQLEALLAD